MSIAEDPSKGQSTIRGPYSLFDDSYIIEFVEAPKTLDATCLLRVTLKNAHPLISGADPKKHPSSPPAHLHFVQSETFQVLQGKLLIQAGWDCQDIILTPESGRLVIPPWTPHVPYPVPGTEDTVVLVWAHPQRGDEPIDAVFFERVLLKSDEYHRQGKPPSLLQMTYWLHESATTNVMLRSWSFLGPLRWIIPYGLQVILANFARVLGYEPLLPAHPKAE